MNNTETPSELEARGPRLAPEHRAHLEAHAIDLRLAEKLGVRSALAPDDLPAELIRWGTRLVPSILFPWKIGERTWWQARPDHPIEREGDRPLKYVFEDGSGGALWLVHDPAAPIGVLLVEGTKQALAVASLSPPWRVVTMGGCYGWVSEGAVAPDLFNIAAECAAGDQTGPGPLVIFADADLRTNPDVHDAVSAALGALPAATGASSVTAAVAQGTGSTGIDDALAAVPLVHRALYLERMIGTATAKIGARPSGKKHVPDHLPSMLFDADGSMNPASVAVWLDKLRPWAVGPDLRSLYRYDEQSGLYLEQLNLLARLASVLGDDVKRISERDVAAALVAQCTRNDRRIRSTDDVTNLIGVENGVLDPDTGELLEPDPDHLLIERWPVRYDPEAECPTIMAYLERHAPEQVDALLDTAARMLDRDRVAQDRALLLFGPPRSGKSTVLRLLAGLVGPAGTSAATLHMLAENRFAPSQLYGKALNVSGELSGRGISAETFNRITGGDEVDCDRKGRDVFPFVNRALLAFAGNEIPALYGGAQAALERLVPICFPVSFSGREDPAVEEALTLELDGLLAELVRRHQAGRIPRPHPAVAGEVRVRSRRIAAFVAARLEVKDPPALHKCPTLAEVHQAFTEWIFRHQKAKPEDEKRLHEVLEELGIEVGRSNGTRVRCRIRDEGDDQTPFEAWLEAVKRGETGSEEGGEPAEEGGESLGTQGRDRLDRDLTPFASAREKTDDTGFLAHTCKGVAGLSNLSHALAVDLETRSADELHDGRHDFVRLVVLDDEVHGAEAIYDIAQYLAAGETISAHNGFGFDFEALRQTIDIDVIELADRRQLFDTFLASLVVDPPMVDFGRSGAAGRVKRAHGLDQIAERLGHDGKAGDIERLARRHGGFDKIPLDDPELLTYARRDGELQRLVTDHLAAELERTGRLEYAMREQSVFARLTAGITHHGFAVDRELLDARLAEGVQRRGDLVAWLAAEHGLPTTTKAGEPSTNPIATEAGREAITSAFERLGLDRRHLGETPGGKVALGAEALRAALADLDRDPETEPIFELAEVLAELQGIRTVYGTLDTYERHGRVHPSVLPLQASGRLSVQSPGLTVLGKRGGKHIEREVLIADPGELVLCADLSQIDARAVAAHAGDHGYLELFSGDHDIHTATAIEVLGDARYREQAKALNHGVNYGMGAGAMVRHARKVGAEGVTIELAQRFLETMDERYPRLAAWKAEVREQAEAGLVLDNGFGRPMRADDERAYTQAPALIGQGCARDLMMQCVLRLDVRVVRMLRAIVHDELVFSVPAGEVAEVRAEVEQAMRFEWAPDGASRPVPILGDSTPAASSWGGCYRKGDA